MQREFLNTGRLDSIDVAKGIGIILVIFGHLLFDNSVIKIAIYSFHMPLFFIVSGYVMTVKSTKQLIIKRIFTLVVPYFIWAMIYSQFSFVNLAYIVYGTNESLIIAGSNGMLWFLPCMFFALIFANWLLLFFKDKKRINLLLIIAIIVFVALSRCLYLFHNKIVFNQKILGLPFGLDIVFLATAFILFGYLLSNIVSTIGLCKFNKRWFCIFGLLTFSSLMGLFQSTSRGYSQMATGNIGIYSLYFIVGCTSCVGVMSLSTLLCSYKRIKFILSWLGKNSMAIFIIHRSLLYYCKEIYSEFPSLIVLIVVFFVLVIYGVIVTNVVNKFIPEVFGKSKS